MSLKLGMIGLSVGNGHPYSWAAICNGYSPEHMNACEFPVIPQYLAKQAWPDARIPGVEVTHIWTQDAELSLRVAKAALIAHVVEEPAAMLGQIDALLLARDDAMNHLAFATPFLEAGIPVYIDKPVALSRDGMDALYRLQKYEGQIFTCSALRYAKELMLSESDRERIGPVRHLQATTPKSWGKIRSAHHRAVVADNRRAGGHRRRPLPNFCRKRPVGLGRLRERHHRPLLRLRQGDCGAAVDTHPRRTGLARACIRGCILRVQDSVERVC